jgi:hypothetical protein
MEGVYILMDHEEIFEYLAHRHEISDLEFVKEDGDKVFFTGIDNDLVTVGICLEAFGDRVEIYFCYDGQSQLEEVVTVESYDEFLEERAGV